ncbi:MAG: urease accessory protein UreD [Pseudomonadales bacterium]|nr:urease accessory protein UreD [Pseudomonadales bacterium]
MNPAPPQPYVKLQRSKGSVRLQFKCRESAGQRKTVLGELYQEGCSKIRFPLTDNNQPFEAVLINTAGGLTDGDEMSCSVDWQAHTQALVTSQAAERIYKSRQKPAILNTRLRIAQSAQACWIPQESIVFDAGRFRRETEIHVHSTASFLGVESLVFGRAAMGELMQEGSIFDSWRIYIDEKLVFADTLEIDSEQHGSVQAFLNQPAIANGASAMATLVFVHQDCKQYLNDIRDVIDASEITGGASCLGPLILVRLLAYNGKFLRETIVQLFNSIHQQKIGIPRVWNC